jgi:hypothetical protein
MLCLMLLFYGCASAYAYAALNGGDFPPLRHLDELLGAGFDAGNWQRMAFPRFMHAAAAVDARAAAWSVLFDLGMVVTYAWFLGWLAVRRFLHLVGLPGSTGAPAAPEWLLLAVGWLPCALVMAAVAEDVATLLALAFERAGAPLPAYIAALLMAVANNAKWMALAFTLAAFAASWAVPFTARRRPPAAPRPGLPPRPA